ncbi:MAG: hypothetical protein JO101_12980, partial [Candidatus Eremiobacteraeota bacterium]|nr:hypothetical protein [Candidatus Eremiobacteraeota bacterium]
GSDGVRAKGGRRLVFEFVTATGSQDADSAIELIRADWKEIGVDINVRHYLSTMLFAPFADGGIVYAGKFDIVVFAWLPNPDGNLRLLYSSDEIPPNGQNDMRYRNPAADAEMLRYTLSYDPTLKKRLDASTMRRIVADVPTIVLRIREDLYGFNDDLQGFHPNVSTPFDDMMNVDI